MCERKSTTHAKATNLAFKHVDPILAVGDSKGAVILVKLSPFKHKQCPFRMT
jgi:hypothetical protein